MPSSPQTITTRGVFDYLYNSAGKAIVGATVNCTLNFNGGSVTSPVVNLGEFQQSTVTDQNGFWRFNLVPNDTITPSGTLYSINAGNIASYEISVPSGGLDVQSSSILANTPSVLSPAVTGLTGPITITGNETVTGNLTVSGISTIPTLSGDVVFNNNASFHGPNPWFDAKNFGATGNGVTDDTTSLQNWINTLAGSGATAVGQGFLPPGNYKVTGTLTVPTTLSNGILMQGSGRSTTTITQATQNIDTIKITKGPGRVVQNVFRDLTLTGPNAGTSGFGVNVEGDVVFERCVIQNFWTNVRLLNCFYGFAEDTLFANAVQDGLFIDTGSTTWIGRGGNRYSNNGRYGVFCPSGSLAGTHLRFSGDYFEQNIARALHFDGEATGTGNRHVLSMALCYLETTGAGATHELYLGPTQALQQVTLIGCRFNDEGTAIIHCEIVNCFSALLAGNYFGQASTGQSLQLDAGAKGVIELGNYYYQTPNRAAGTIGYVLGQPAGQAGTAIPLAHARSYGPAPTITAVNAGISGTPTVNGNDRSGIITFTTTGAAPAGGAALFTVNFAVAYASAPTVILTPNASPAVVIVFQAGALAAGSFRVDTGNALVNATTYIVGYLVEEHN